MMNSTDCQHQWLSQPKAKQGENDIRVTGYRRHMALNHNGWAWKCKWWKELRKKDWKKVVPKHITLELKYYYTGFSPDASSSFCGTNKCIKEVNVSWLPQTDIQIKKKTIVKHQKVRNRLRNTPRYNSNVKLRLVVVRPCFLSCQQTYTHRNKKDSTYYRTTLVKSVFLYRTVNV